jgi:predicted nucleotidyltransferase
MITAKLIKKFIAKALHALEGDWVIIGGTVLPLIGVDLRETMDIDIVGFNNSDTNIQTIKLMEIAESLGLPVETINQAGAYFLQKIPDFENELVLIDGSDSCRIYRPNAYLYLLLKTSRSSSSDIQDSIAFLRQNEKESLLLKTKIRRQINLKCFIRDGVKK